MIRRLFPFLLLLILSASCAKKEVKIEFELSKDVNMPVRVLFFEEDEKGGGQFKETVADIHSGKGNFKVTEPDPVILYLYAPSGKMPSAVIYAKPGDEIKISGSGQDISKWKIEGNDVSLLLSEWHAKNGALLSEGYGPKLNEAVAEFIGRNSGSVASAILLYLYFDRRNNEAEFFSLQAKIDNGILNDPALARSLSVSDLFTGLPAASSIPKEIVKVGESGYADTLRPADQAGLMLIFRSKPHGQDGFSTDSIGNLVKRNKKLKVVEFYAETDSSAWRKHLGNDTIEGLQRLWLPLGLADSLSLNLGVKRLPYILVADSLAKEKYRGSDWKEAVKSFEELKPDN